MSEPILEIRDLHVSITDKPEVQIIKGIDLVIRPGEVHTIMGPNGSGKSTLSSTIAGSPSYTVDSGRILYRGEDITRLPPASVAQLGMVRSFQISAVFPHLTTLENVRIALQRKHSASFDFWRSKAVLDALHAFLKANNLKTDWQGIESAPNEALVNALAMMCPFDPIEKQALLEARDFQDRTATLLALLEMGQGTAPSTVN